MNKLKYHLCSNCHNATMREHPNYNGIVKCTYCGYSIDRDKHMDQINKKERECLNLVKNQKKD